MEMVETKSIIAAAMCTTKIPASNTSILAVRWVAREQRVLKTEDKGDPKVTVMLSEANPTFSLQGLSVNKRQA